MTRRKPRRDKCGRFIERGQTPRERPRPDAPLVAPVKSTVKMGHLAVRVCEECSAELEERRVRIKGYVLYISHCPRCCPDPLEVLS